MEVEDSKDQPQEGTKLCIVSGSNVFFVVCVDLYITPHCGDLVVNEEGSRHWKH